MESYRVRPSGSCINNPCSPGWAGSRTRVTKVLCRRSPAEPPCVKSSSASIAGASVPPYVVPATAFHPLHLSSSVTGPWPAGAGPGLHVPLHVQRQVVGAGERPVAQVALEGPVARVLAVVAGELVGAGELPSAAVPVAVVGLLTCGETAQSVTQRRSLRGNFTPSLLSFATQPSYHHSQVLSSRTRLLSNSLTHPCLQ